MWNIEKICGYKPITTFWDDFSIAEHFGASAIRDTYNKVFTEWKGNYKYLTELVMVLNHKIWEHYQKNPMYSALYNMLWEKADGYACKTLVGVEADYFYTTTD